MRRGPTAPAWLAIGTVSLVIIGGCGSAPSVSSMSIANRQSGPASLLTNPGFEADTLAPWFETLNSGGKIVLAKRFARSGHHSAGISMPVRAITRTVALSQLVQELPARRPGSAYVLRLRAYVVGLTRSVGLALKLNYPSGQYTFFYGGPVVAGGTGKPLSGGIGPGTRRRWERFGVDAVARRHLQSIEVFALNEGPGRVRGSVWIDDVVLRQGNAGGSR